MKYYVDALGNYLGGWDAKPPEGAIEVPFPPEDARQIWDSELGSYEPLFIAPFPNLEPYQFHAMVLLTGYSADIEAAIDADPEPAFKAAAWAKYRYSTHYKRFDPFVVALAAAVGLTPEQLDALWLDAANF